MERDVKTAPRDFPAVLAVYEAYAPGSNLPEPMMLYLCYGLGFQTGVASDAGSAGLSSAAGGGA
jgi:hypothetical protein